MTEAEYVTITHSMKEALWLRSLISQPFDIVLDSTTLFSDNQFAIQLTKDHQYHARTKYINIHFHFIWYIVEGGSIRLVYCPTDNMTTDTLTKALLSTKTKHFASQLRLSPAWGGVLDLQAVVSHDGLPRESLSLASHHFLYCIILYTLFPCCFKTNLFGHSFYLQFISRYHLLTVVYGILHT